MVLTPGNFARSGRRVLVVDDDGDVRALVRLLLQRAGCIVTEAPDAEGALAATRRHRFDVVVLDNDLGAGARGIEIASKLKALSPGAVIVLHAADAGAFEGAPDLDHTVAKGGAGDLVQVVLGDGRRTTTGEGGSVPSVGGSA